MRPPGRLGWICLGLLLATSVAQAQPPSVPATVAVPDRLPTETYLFTLAWCGSAVAALVAVGRAGRSRPWLRRFEVALGTAGLGLWAFKVTWFSLPPAPAMYLPLHLCNLTELACYLSLLTRRPWLQPLVYFWALGAVLAFVTPQMRSGPEYVEYWLFWLPHTLIVGLAAYEVIVRGYRPRLRDVGFVSAVTVIYLAVVFPVNLLIGTNYAYLGPSLPDAPSLLDVLGPWPLRVLWVVLLAAAVFLLGWLPWAVAALRKPLEPSGGTGRCQPLRT